MTNLNIADEEEEPVRDQEEEKESDDEFNLCNW